MADDNTSKEAFTAEQVEKLNAMMGNVVNNMFVARMATAEKKILDKVTATIGESLKTQLPEFLKELHPPPSDGKDGKDGKGGKRGDDGVELATLRKQIEDLRTANLASENARKAADAKLREKERQRLTLDALAKGGITDPFKQELAIAYLDRHQRVQWSNEDDDASLLWNDGVNPVSFNEGVASWFKSEEVKHFLPATGMRGTGSRPVQGSLPNGQKPNDEQRWQMVGEAFKEAWDRGV